ncbi:MAG: 5-fold beta-flower protein [Clostridium sp.]|uniref:5-fold beta-flower protein n=1 Tax=Clostridium sp. TaxID=1506 RepID=UPI0039EBFA15
MERIYDHRDSTYGYLRGNRIYCKKNKLMGYVYGNSLYNPNGQLAGYVNDGVVYNCYGYPVGYASQSDYTVYDGSRQHVGHVHSTFTSLVAAAGLLLLLGGIFGSRHSGHGYGYGSNYGYGYGYDNNYGFW